MQAREKMERFGGKALTDVELVALILGTGDRKRAGEQSSVGRVAQQVLEDAGSLSRLIALCACSPAKFCGIGPTKAARFEAMREIFRRISLERAALRPKVSSAREAFAWFRHLALYSQETVACLFLNGRNRLIGFRELYRGSIASSPGEPREILRAALEINATKIILAHNHPSGESEPSEEDVAMTVQLEWAARLVGIPLVDHLIVAGWNSYFSFADANLLRRQADESGNTPLIQSPSDPYPCRQSSVPHPAGCRR